MGMIPNRVANDNAVLRIPEEKLSMAMKTS